MKREHSIEKKGGKLKITFVLIVAKVKNFIKISMKLYSCVNIHECDNKIAGNLKLHILRLKFKVDLMY